MFLGGAGLVAGFIDAIAGGGGLITVPALLAAGLPPISALATNKLQSVWGVAMSCYRFWRAGLVDLRAYGWTGFVVFALAGCGGLAVQAVPSDHLGRLMPVLILGVVAYVLFSPRMTDADSHERLSQRAYAPIAGAIGFYDGFFGPGAGSFYTTSLVALRGHGLVRAAANSKFFNFMSNFAATILFVGGGHALLLPAAVMAIGAISGAWIGAHVAIRFGARVIRPLLVAISLILTAKLIVENF